ncbi:putative gpi anchored protein [Rosellinia necatrix]|uniref:Putative gpi anchored protein n=1 Tax=Rosellinia necatrix TaxID=77044 RepID=A0A1W2TWC5_ROSNE|nr:putative gpi anchored protein [Rosellinia necatrix]
MQLQQVLAILAAATLGAAENNVGTSDVPSACLPACQFTIDLSARCDRETSDDDGYTPCVCGAADSQQRLTECASCVKDNGRSDPDDNDVADLMDDCGWDFNDADVPYPTSGSGSGSGSGSTTTVVGNPSPTTTAAGATVTVTDTAPSQTANPGSTTTVTAPGSEVTSPGSTTTVTAPSSGATTTPPVSVAGALSARAVAGPLLAGLFVGVAVLL